MTTCFGKNVNQCVCASLPFGFKGGIRNLIVLVHEHCNCFYLHRTQ